MELLAPQAKRRLMRAALHVRAFALLMLAAVLLGSAPAGATSPATITTLSVSANTVALGTAIVLTATDTVGGAPLYPGQVTFNYQQVVNGVTFSSSFGVAQLTSIGAASIAIQPGVGTFVITAAFAGSAAGAPSVSAAKTVTVTATGGLATETQILPSGTPGNYTLTARVGEFGLLAAPSGMVSFLNTTDGNQSLATATLNPGPAIYGMVPAANSPTGSANPIYVAAGDLNGDGLADIISLDFDGSTSDPGTVGIRFGLGNNLFSNPVHYALGAGQLGSVTIADVNNDGLPDLLVVDSALTPGDANHNIQVMLGTGGGNFQLPTGPQIVTTGQGPNAVAAADLNNDGNLDLVVTNRFDDTISVFLGDGTGAFIEQAQSPLPSLGASPFGVVVADLNNDGIPDIAVTNAGIDGGPNDTRGSITIYFGAGDGTFPTSTNFLTATQTSPLSIASVRNNGVLDLIVPDGDASIFIYLGNNDGTFAPPVTTATSLPIFNVLMVDVNHDGKLDMVGSGDGYFTGGSNAVLFLGNGDGTFGPEQDFPVGLGLNNVAMADFNNDGLMDFITGDQGDGAGAGTINLLLGVEYVTATGTGVTVPGPGPQAVDASYPGDGTHAASVSATTLLLPVATTTVLSASPSSTTVGAPITLIGTAASTLNGPASGGTISFYNGSTLVETANVINGSASFTTSSLAAGYTNLYAVYSGTAVLGTSTSNTLRVFIGAQTSMVLSVSANTVVAGNAIVLTATGINSPSGTPLTPGQVNFTYQQTANGVTLPGSFGTAQLTSAGTAVLTVKPSAGTYVITAAFAGTTQVSPSSSAAQTVTIVGNAGYPSTTTLVSSGTVGDYTLTATIAGFGFSPSGLVSFLNTTNANASIATALIDPASVATTLVSATGAPFSNPNVSTAATGDLNGDGLADLVTATCGGGAGTASVQLGNGDGTFQTAVPYQVSGCTSLVAIGDVNGDGHPDLVAVNEFDGTVSILLGIGDGTFTLQSPALQVGTTYPSASPAAVSIADLNQDGKLDIVTGNEVENDVSVFLGNGDGTFQAEQTYAAGSGPNSIVTSDLNNDGILDLLVANQNDGTVSVLLGVGDGTFQAQTSFTFSPYSPAASLAVGSLRGNGTIDLVAPAAYFPAFFVYLGNNDGTFAAPATIYLNNDSVSSIVLTDVNHDGKLDVVVAYFGQLGIFYGLGDGTFGPEVDVSTGQGPNGGQAYISLVSADLNNDGLVDFITADPFDFTSAVLLGQQSATATATAVYVLGTGTQNVDASFPGDDTHAASVSTTVPLQPSIQSASSTTLAASSPSIVVGGMVTFTATVTPVPTGETYGTVSFYNGTSLLGSSPASAGGSAIYSTAALPAGINAITAVYSGNAALALSTSGVLTEMVTYSTSTQLTSTSMTSVFGQPLTLTASVVPAPLGSLPGSVSFYQGVTLLGSSALNPSGSASFTITALPVGLDTVTAVYSGNPTYTTSASTPLSITVSAITTAVDLTSSNQNATSGQNVVLTATVTPVSTDTNRGTVSFYLGSTLLGSSALSAGGVAMLNVNNLPVGVDSVTAAYAGSAAYAASTSDALSITVTAIATTTVLLSSSANTGYGGLVTLTATVAPTSTDAARGTVSFHVGSMLLGSSALSAGGVATLAVNNLPVGVDSVTAAYAGSAAYAASTSSALSITVTAIATATVVTSSSPNPGYGQPVTLTATVTPASTDAVRGTVSFYAGHLLLGTGALGANGIATLNTSSIPIGTDVITAVYTGSADYAPSTSGALSLSAQAATAITFSANPTTQLFNNPILLTAQVSSVTGGTQTGTVSFMDGSNLLGTSPVAANGQANFISTTLADGSHNLNATYSGDTDFLPSASTGAPVAITIADLNLALGGDKNKTVAPGAAVTYNFPLSPVVTPTFLYDVTLTASGLPPGATYTFSPATIPAGSGTLPVAFTVQTAASPAVGALTSAANSGGRWYALAFGLLLPLAGFSSVRRRLLLPTSLMLLLFGAMGMSLVAGLTGCGAGGLFSKPLAQAPTSYTITISATSGSLVRTSTVQLNLSN